MMVTKTKHYIQLWSLQCRQAGYTSQQYHVSGSRPHVCVFLSYIYIFVLENLYVASTGTDKHAPLSPHSDRWSPVSKHCSVKLMFSSFPYFTTLFGIEG